MQKLRLIEFVERGQDVVHGESCQFSIDKPGTDNKSESVVTTVQLPIDIAFAAI